MSPDPNTVVADYDRFIRCLARRYWVGYGRRAELDDITQAVRIGFWKAAQSYDPTRGTFESYARLLCRSVVRDEVGRAPEKRSAAQSYGAKVALDTISNRSERKPDAPGLDLWERIAPHLTAGELRAVELHFRAGVGWKRAAKELGVARGTVRDAVKRAVKKLREALSVSR